jgi:hypothetical protein
VAAVDWLLHPAAVTIRVLAAAGHAMAKLMVVFASLGVQQLCVVHTELAGKMLLVLIRCVLSKCHLKIKQSSADPNFSCCGTNQC